jgi:hypothetical protein
MSVAMQTKNKPRRNGAFFVIRGLFHSHAISSVHKRTQDELLAHVRTTVDFCGELACALREKVQRGGLRVSGGSQERRQMID